jgi:hypothetical protein
MLQMGFGQPEISGPAEAAPPDALRVRALTPRPLGILGGELGGLLPLPCGLDGLVVGLRPNRELAGGVFRPRTRPPSRTRTAGHRVKADAPDGIPGDIPARGLLDTGLSLGTAGLFGLPI